MEGPGLAVLPIPRLRLSRNAHLFDTAGAGPSRTRFQDSPFSPPVETDHNSEDNSDDYDDDQLPTPRITSTATLISAETPAERLRAVLARVPTSKSTPMPHSPIRTPSVLDSDFEPPDDCLPTPSMARESLKAIFSRAVREPGDTPQKESNRMRRRNSIDASEVEASPRVYERTKNKGKRRSLSDEEAERPVQTSEASFRSSQAATFDILRERLTNSHTLIKDQHLSDFIYNQSIPDDNSHETAAILRDLHSSRPPPATSTTPQESLRMSTNSQFQFESNLLEQDSEMQRAIEGLNSYDDSGSSQRPVSFPPTRAATSQSSAQKHLPGSPQGPKGFQTSLSQSKTISLDKPPGSTTREGNEEMRPPSRSSSHSSLGHYRDADSNELREREREWNKPRTPLRSHTPDLQHQHSSGRFSGRNPPAVTGPNGGTLSRRNSTTSLRSFDDDSSKGSSFGSQAEYRERIAELERERNVEREREWNKRKPALSRPRSSLSLNSSTGLDRTRTRSFNQISRPESAGPPRGISFPDRHHRRDSFSGSSRASSPAGSLRAGHSGKKDVEGEEIVHERERNWNAPRPKWTQHAPASPSESSRLHPLTGERARAESLKALRPTKGESPVPHVRADSTIPNANGLDGQTGQTVAFPAQAPSPPQEKSILSLEAIRTPVQTERSRFPFPSTKGKEKENEIPQTRSFAAQLQSQTMDATSTSGSHFGFAFMRNRTILPPIDFEKSPERSTPSHNKDSSLPSPTSPDKLSEAVKRSHIPARSPRKEKVNSAPMSGKSTTHVDLSQLDSRNPEFNSRNLAPTSFLSIPLTENQENGDNREEKNSISPDRTPTIRTMPPLPLKTPEYTPPRSPSPPPLHHTPVSDESRLQKAIGSNYNTVAPTNPDSTPTSLQEISPPPSPTASQPRQTSQSPEHSFSSTPQRRSSFSASRVEFQTPSPPKSLPELPGPPSSSGGEDDLEEAERERTFIRDAHYNLTAMKTPRPPGAWTTTPGAKKYGGPSSGDELDNNQIQTPVRDLRPDFKTAKTPRPPGAWASTPAPPHRETPSEVHSYAGDTDLEHESGLATPVASLSRASSLPLPAQTPAPPGAWMATPGRKSILKVRFDTHAGANQSLSNDTIESSKDFVDGIANASWHVDNVSADTNPLVENEEPPRSRTPEPSSTPLSPSRSPRKSPRKSPSIRVLDAFGREQVTEAKSKRGSGSSGNKSGIRVVDAMGRDIENSGESSVLGNTEEKDPPPLKRNEALVRIRRGLSDLAHGLDEINNADQNVPLNYARLRELNNESRKSRKTREQLSQTLSAAEADLRSKLEPLRASMRKNNLLTSTVDRGFPGFRMSPWMIWTALFVQLLLILLMYRLSVIQARNKFLTTFYDPFYPDLHLHVFKPNTIQHSTLPPSGTSWLSIPNILFREGWGASARQIWDNFSILINKWQDTIWEAWGDESVQTNISWPPT